MDMIFVLVSIIQSIAISLGVGCSTVAIASFFVAIADGKVEPDERKMLGVVYTLLRIAMIFILLTSALLSYIHLSTGGYFTPFIQSQWILLAVLFTNAVLMTKRIMPSAFGPAIQAATWYTLGVTMSLIPLNLAGYSLFEFIFGYLAAIALAITVVNALMSYLKSHT